MKKVTLIAEWYSDNLGDGLLSSCFEKIFSCDSIEVNKIDISKKEKFNNYIDDTSLNCQTKSSPSLFKKMIPTGLKQIIIIKKNFPDYNKYLYSKNIQDCDQIIFVGGQMFMWYFSYPIYKIVKLAAKKGIPVYFYACGVGNNKNFLLNKLLTSALNNPIVKNISCRDDCSYLRSIVKNDDKIKFTYDAGLYCSKLYGIKGKNSNKVGIGIMFLENIEISKLEKFWKKSIDYLLNNEENIEIFCNGNTKDYSFAYNIYKKYYMNNSNVSFSKKPTSPNELVSIIKKYERIISMRLHSLIIASSYEIPITAIFWDKKVELIFNKIQKNLALYNMKDIYDDSSLLLKNSSNDVSINIIQDKIFRDIIELRGSE